MAKTEPSVDQWLREAKADPAAAQCGMFLTHNGVVRITPKAQVREGVEGLGEVVAVEFSLGFLQVLVLRNLWIQ